MKKAVITVDVELDSEKGGTDGIDRLDEILKDREGSTLFVTAKTMKKVPDKVREWSGDHEIGLHIHPEQLGFDDDLFDRHTLEEQRRMFQRSLSIFDDHLDRKKIDSFRPGRWRFHENIYDLMKEFDMTHSSSRYPKPRFENPPQKIKGVVELDPTIWSPFPFNKLCHTDENSEGFENPYGTDLPIHFLKKFGVVFNAALCNHIDYPLLYLASTRLSDLEHQMFTFHSFNLLDEKMETRVKDVIRHLEEKRELIELSEVSVG